MLRAMLSIPAGRLTDHAARCRRLDRCGRRRAARRLRRAAPAVRRRRTLRRAADRQRRHEHLALAALARTAGPAILLAHPERNSLPAALEILGALRQSGAARLDRHGQRRTRVRRRDDPPRPASRGESRLRAARIGRIGAPSDWLVASVPGPGPSPRRGAGAGRRAARGGARGGCASADPSRPHDPATRWWPAPSRCGSRRRADLDAAAAVAAALRSVVRRHRLDACAVRCFDLVVDRGTTGCVGLSWLLDEGVTAGCEGDVPATLTMLWLRLVTGEPPFMANPQDLDPGQTRSTSPTARLPAGWSRATRCARTSSRRSASASRAPSIRDRQPSCASAAPTCARVHLGRGDRRRRRERATLPHAGDGAPRVSGGGAAREPARQPPRAHAWSLGRRAARVPRAVRRGRLTVDP